MVIQKTIDNLKEKPKEDRKVVAGGIAFALLVLLFFAWAFFFFKKLQHSNAQQLGGGAQEEFNPSSVRDAQQQLMQETTNVDELKAAREQSGSNVQQGVIQQDYQQGSGDQFGGSGSTE